jgi:hypothetical protein
MPYSLNSYEELNKLTTSELVDKINENVSRHNTGGGLEIKPFFNAQFYVSEVVKRQQDKQTKTMLCMTWAITGMTVVITVATLINLFLALRVYKLTDLMYQLMQRPPH